MKTSEIQIIDSENNRELVVRTGLWLHDLVNREPIFEFQRSVQPTEEQAAEEFRKRVDNLEQMLHMNHLQYRTPIERKKGYYSTRFLYLPDNKPWTYVKGQYMDESDNEAAKREMYEETGVRFPMERFVRLGRDRFRLVLNPREVRTIEMSLRAKILNKSGEIFEYRWVPIHSQMSPR
jgi:NUDIX domain